MYIYDIQSVKQQLRVSAVSKIILLHSFPGCDITSRIAGIGQDKLLRLVSKLDEGISSVFYICESTKEEIRKSGERLFALLLNLPPEIETLDDAILRTFNTKVLKSSTAIECTTLPLTSAELLISIHIGSTIRYKTGMEIN